MRVKPDRFTPNTWHVEHSGVPMRVRKVGDIFETSADNGHTWASSPVADAALSLEGAAYAHAYYYR